MLNPLYSLIIPKCKFDVNKMFLSLVESESSAAFIIEYDLSGMRRVMIHLWQDVVSADNSNSSKKVMDVNYDSDDEKQVSEYLCSLGLSVEHSKVSHVYTHVDNELLVDKNVPDVQNLKGFLHWANEILDKCSFRSLLDPIRKVDENSAVVSCCNKNHRYIIFIEIFNQGIVSVQSFEFKGSMSSENYYNVRMKCVSNSYPYFEIPGEIRHFIYHCNSRLDILQSLEVNEGNYSSWHCDKDKAVGLVVRLKNEISNPPAYMIGVKNGMYHNSKKSELWATEHLRTLEIEISDNTKDPVFFTWGPPSITPVDRELLSAAKTGDMKGLINALQAGANVDALCPYSEMVSQTFSISDSKCTSLILTARYNHLELLKLLLAVGADTNVLVDRGTHHYNALDCAIDNNNFKIKDVLESIGCKSTRQNSQNKKFI